MASDFRLTEEQVRSFVTDGFVSIRGAFSAEVAAEARSILWLMAGCDPDDPSTWNRPVIRVPGAMDEPFQQAADAPKLQTVYDQLVGPGRWWPRVGLGSFPIRFPHPDDPGDCGWHLDGSYTPEGESGYWVNLQSRERALLMLFLFSDVGEDDAPTRIKVGSHLDVPPFLVAAGERGRNFFDLCAAMDAAGKLDSPERPTVLATGAAGDVFVCHPFLIHAAQPIRGSRPRFLAQPPLTPRGVFRPERPDVDLSPVEFAIKLGLATRQLS